ncbi:hypothetical protein QFC22_005459 [Naganishia vaughanmartiniae]|uniref:Uncharacterized protein n=1 Tax=Naganishia vaughanmartiniae TaxID=1424756 RepID=A0ACC2WVH1_9TREE|nr:hypothetical protein QFC22_005459 [Naganishia vaughanmartiniae]
MFTIRLAARPAARLRFLHRTISTTPRLEAQQQSPPPPPAFPSDSSDDISSAASGMMSTLAQSPLYNVIKSRPGAIEAIKTVGDLMQKKGIDVTAPPSKMTMLQLAMDSEFREAIKTVMSELKAAGVDVTPENIQQLMGPLGKK